MAVCYVGFLLEKTSREADGKVPLLTQHTNCLLQRGEHTRGDAPGNEQSVLSIGGSSWIAGNHRRYQWRQDIRGEVLPVGDEEIYVGDDKHNVRAIAALRSCR